MSILFWYSGNFDNNEQSEKILLISITFWVFQFYISDKDVYDKQFPNKEAISKIFWVFKYDKFGKDDNSLHLWNNLTSVIFWILQLIYQVN